LNDGGGSVGRVFSDFDMRGTDEERFGSIDDRVDETAMERPSSEMKDITRMGVGT